MNKKQNSSNEKVILFPGMRQRYILLAKEQLAAKDFKSSVENFELAMQLEELSEEEEIAYIFSLKEGKYLQEAKQQIEQLLKKSNQHTIEIVELYISILIELRDFQEAMQILETLLAENAVPITKQGTFKQLLDLSKRLSENKQSVPFSMESFLEWTVTKQQQFIVQLTSENSQDVEKIFVEIAQSNKVSEIINTYALISLIERKYDGLVQVKKFGQATMINPLNLALPSELPFYKEIIRVIHRQLDQQPSLLEMVESIILRHSVVTFPFPVVEGEILKIANGYIQYVQCLLEGTSYSTTSFTEKIQKYEQIISSIET